MYANHSRPQSPRGLLELLRCDPTAAQKIVGSGNEVGTFSPHKCDVHVPHITSIPHVHSQLSVHISIIGLHVCQVTLLKVFDSKTLRYGGMRQVLADDITTKKSKPKGTKLN